MEVQKILLFFTFTVLQITPGNDVTDPLITEKYLYLHKNRYVSALDTFGFIKIFRFQAMDFETSHAFILN